MVDDQDKSEASLHTVDIETMGDRYSEAPPGDCLCTSCWALFDGTDLPTCPSCGELASEEGWPELPYTFLDRYVFLSLLGRGGVGAVFRARHVDESRGDEQFAVKVVQQGARPERRRLLSQMFEREISAASLVGRSRHFVRVLGHDTGDHLHLAMEYVPWPTLKVRLKRDGILPPREVAKLGIALLRALEVMHAHNLVHRDLKPANIFVTDEEDEIRVKVADLGLWILSEHQRGGVTESLPAGSFAGTLDYASPEQMDGIGIGLPSDLHAVGSILWAAATGDVPFPAMGASFIASMKSKRQLVEALPARPANMPEALYEVLIKALQPRAEDRFATAHEFASALELLVQDTEAFAATHLRPTVPAPRPRPTSQEPTPQPSTESAAAVSKPRPRWPWYAGAGVISVVVGYAAMTSMQEPSKAPAPPVASSASDLPEPPPATSAVAPPPLTGPKIEVLALGRRHSCALLDGGVLKCWGTNERGQLGDGTTTGRSQPTAVTGLGDVADVALGSEHTCARTTDGKVWCWGQNDSEELGDGTREARAAPMQVKGLPPVEKLFVGGCQSWAVTENDETWGWGCNDLGQLSGKSKDTRPRRYPNLDGLRTIFTWESDGDGVACALFDDRPTSCWLWGKVPDGARANAVEGQENVAELAFARSHGCALLKNGTARCWGANSSGEVGDGTRQPRPKAVDIANVKDIQQVVVGDGYACARQKGGKVLCWGRNDHGQAGGRGPEDHLVPVAVPDVTDAIQIATDRGRTCAVIADGRVGCWGTGLSNSDKTVVWMDAMAGAASVEASGHGVICTIASSGGAACLGDDEFGQLGIGRSLQRFKPARVAALEGISKLWAAARNACAVDEQKRLWCWGSNVWSAFEAGAGTQSRPVLMGPGVEELAMGTHGLYTFVKDEKGARSVRGGGTLLRDHGAGASAQRAYPQPVPALEAATQIAVGLRHGCARMADGSVSCWGANTYGQLGNGSPRATTRPTPVLIEGEVTQVASGAFHACALRKTGGAVCWGSNGNGQTGPGPTWTCNVGTRVFPCVRRPRRVLGIQDVIGLAAGQWHTCALSKSGAVSCWGANGVGQLGDGTAEERSKPEPVRGISNAVQLAVGEQHACAALRDGAVWCWGDNGYGELGRSTKEKCGPSKEPCGKVAGPVAGLTDAVQVATGWEFSCALRKDATVWCWGNNQRGTLGDGEPLERNEAVRVVW